VGALRTSSREAEAERADEAERAGAVAEQLDGVAKELAEATQAGAVCRGTWARVTIDQLLESRFWNT
jgi:hypothetical protein